MILSLFINFRISGPNENKNFVIIISLRKARSAIIRTTFNFISTGFRKDGLQTIHYFDEFSTDTQLYIYNIYRLISAKYQ